MKKILMCMLALVFSVSLMSINLGQTLASNNNSTDMININEKTATSETVYDYEQDFSDLGKVNEDFSAYYMDKFMGILTNETVVDTDDMSMHWKLADNKLNRINDISTSKGAENISILTLTKKKYTNFELKIDMRQGSVTDFWSVLCIRQDEAGKHFFQDGEGFYIEREGNVRAWGRALDGGPFKVGFVPNYNKNEWYTYVVRVEGNIMTIEVGGVTSTVRLRWSFYRPGYISLMSFNNNSEFKNLKIKELPATTEIGTDIPFDQTVGGSNGEDSLDNLVGDTGSIDDIKDKVEVKNEDEETKGCGAIAFDGNIFGGGMTILIVASGLCLILTRRKPKYERV